MPAVTTTSRQLAWVDGYDYGMRGDAIQVTDAAITSGTPTLTSATAGFRASDVGKRLTVAGAGAAGVPLSSTITGFTNATTVTLAGNASTTVTGQLMRFGSDNTAALQAAQNAVAAAGRGMVWVRPGAYIVASVVELNAGSITIAGGGMGVTELWQSATANRIFQTVGSTSKSFLCLRDFTMVGLWDFQRSLGGDNDRHMYVTFYDRTELRNVESRYSRQMGLVVGYSNEVLVTGCRIRYCARDGINVANCGRVVATGNHIRACYDDAIAVHTSTARGNPATEGHVISGNTVEDSFGIKALGAVKTVIAGNTIARPKSYGIFVGVAGTEGENDITDLVISGNVVTDVIDGAKFGGGTQRAGIYISPSATGFVPPVVGGATPVYTYPEDLGYLSNTGVAQNAGAQRIVVTSNVVAQSLPNVAAYSDWGYGQAFTSTGFVNPDLSTGFQQTTIGLNINGAVLNLDVVGNHFECLASGVLLASSVTHVSGVLVSGNVFKRIAEWGVGVETASVIRSRIRVFANVFDMDPYFESVNRVAGGKWSTGAQKPAAIDAVNWESVDAKANSFRNLNQVAHTNAATVIVWSGNTYYMEPAAAYNLFGGANTDNRGIRRADGLDSPDARLVWENSDPTSATYGNVVGIASATGSLSAIPTSGFFVAGQFVRNSNVTQSGSAPNQYTIVGWQRLTTGGGHTLNTDWRELRALTGN